jgi:hypothetical protein
MISLSPSSDLQHDAKHEKQKRNPASLLNKKHPEPANS